MLATANAQWVVKTQTKDVIPLSQHFLTCYDCTNDENFCGEHGKCGSFGKCTCTGGRYGTRCELVACPRLEIDPRNDGFPKAGGGYYASKYYLLRNVWKRYFPVVEANTVVEVNNRPVYISLGENQKQSNDTDIILFTGSSWILSSRFMLLKLELWNVVDELAPYFSYQFHEHLTNYNASYVSEQVEKIDMQEYGQGKTYEASPSGLKWLHPDPDKPLQPHLDRGFINSSFFCAVCNNSTNPCSDSEV